MSSILEGKEQFDGLGELAEQAWRDWDHKARYQWRLSFSIWGAELAATSLVITSKVPISLFTGILVGFAVLAIHLYFMNWIEGRIRDFRRQMYSYVGAMEDLVGTSTALLAGHKKKLSEETALNRKTYRFFAWFQKPAALVQLSITLLLTTAFCVILENIP